jgi:synaptobrevin family protein YKT6
MKIQKELDETKVILHKTIESVLERGEKIDDLVAKSQGLSDTSRMFYSKLRPGILAGPSLTINL